MLTDVRISVRLRAMDKVEYTEAERWLIEPKPGTAAARARDFGVDLSLTVSNLRLTPEERIKKFDESEHTVRRSSATGVRNDYYWHMASLLELEAILEYHLVNKKTNH